MAQRINIRGGGVLTLPDTGGTGRIRKENGYLYSAYLLPTALAKGDYDVFAVGQGAEGQGWGSGNSLTYRETNLHNSGRIPDEQAWALTEVGFGFLKHNVATADVVAILLNTTLIFDAPGYVRPLGPAILFPGGHGMYGVSSENATFQWQNGFQSLNSRRKLANPIILNPGKSFRVHINVNAANFSAPTLAATTPVMVSFWGTRYEAVTQQ